MQGRISASKVLKLMQDNGDFITTSVNYICGSTGLKESVKRALDNLGVDKKNISTEDFELLKNPKEFEGIVAQQVKINFNGAVKQIEVVKGKSILEAGLDAGIELPYACQMDELLHSLQRQNYFRLCKNDRSYQKT